MSIVHWVASHPTFLWLFPISSLTYWQWLYLSLQLVRYSRGMSESSTYFLISRSLQYFLNDPLLNCSLLSEINVSSTPTLINMFFHNRVKALPGLMDVRCMLLTLVTFLNIIRSISLHVRPPKALGHRSMGKWPASCMALINPLMQFGK